MLPVQRIPCAKASCTSILAHVTSRKAPMFVDFLWNTDEQSNLEDDPDLGAQGGLYVAVSPPPPPLLTRRRCAATRPPPSPPPPLLPPPPNSPPETCSDLGYQHISSNGANNLQLSTSAPLQHLVWQRLMVARTSTSAV